MVLNIFKSENFSYTGDPPKYLLVLSWWNDVSFKQCFEAGIDPIEQFDSMLSYTLWKYIDHETRSDE